MIRARKSAEVAEFGDFQTPLALAEQVCALLTARGLRPRSIVEPTCGIGNFVTAALDAFPASERLECVEINPDYSDRLRSRLDGRVDARKVAVSCESFFAVDWQQLLSRLPDPVLVLGNPPWVTNSDLGRLQSNNLPSKRNFQNHRGLDALTGKSNFDVSEWMILKMVEWLNGRHATVAVLCKSIVARKVLSHAWRRGLHLAAAEIHGISAAAHFDAAVDACLLIMQLRPDGVCQKADVYANLGFATPTATLGYRDGLLLSDVDAFERWSFLLTDSGPRWRSGIKHDCASVMELRREQDFYRNALGELVALEHKCLYPMLKSSEISAGGVARPTRYMIVPQRSIGQETSALAEEAPLTWQYLQAHADRLSRRASSIYRNRPQFSVFGVGEYSFAPWKVAISGLYKSLNFSLVGPYDDKPTVLDDTCYFLPCETEQVAEDFRFLLSADPAQEFLASLIFWDSKRPITVEVLRRLDLAALARVLHRPYPPAARQRLPIEPIPSTADGPGLFGP